MKSYQKLAGIWKHRPWWLFPVDLYYIAAIMIYRVLPLCALWIALWLIVCVGRSGNEPSLLEFTSGIVRWFAHLRLFQTIR